MTPETAPSLSDVTEVSKVEGFITYLRNIKKKIVMYIVPHDSN